MGCGRHNRSWRHITKTCPVLTRPEFKEMIPQLDKLPESKKQCKIQVKKLVKLTKFFEAKLNTNICKRRVRVIAESGEITQYYVVRMFWNYE